MRKLAQLDFQELEQASIPNFPANSKPGDVIFSLITYMFLIAGFLLLLYLISGGFQLMVSVGDPKAVEAGKAKVGNALLGFLVIFVAFFLVQVVANVLGIQSVITIFPQ